MSYLAPLIISVSSKSQRSVYKAGIVQPLISDLLGGEFVPSKTSSLLSSYLKNSMQCNSRRLTQSLFPALSACNSQRSLIAVGADSTLWLDGIAITNSLVAYSIVVFVLYTYFSTNIDILLFL